MGLMSTLFQRKSRPLVGVDISGSAIKLVELTGSDENPEVVAFAVEPLPEGAIVDRQVNDADILANALRRTLQRAGTRTQRAALAVPGASVISKVIPMPATLSESDMEEQIQVEADQYIPYPISEVSLDFEVIGPSATDPDAVDVLLAACRREHVEALTQVLELAGIEPAVIDAEPFALENACDYLRRQMAADAHTVAVVDIGNSTTHVNVLHDGDSVFSREHTIGGRVLTEEIARAYGMEPGEAAQKKKENDLPDDYRDTILLPFFDEIAQQIDRSFQMFFASARVSQQIDQLLIAGGSAYLDGIVEHLGQRLQIRAERARPLTGMKVALRSRSANLERNESALLIALGLASRTFDPVR